MSTVLLFHHVLGCTEGIHHFAEQIRQAGHTVHVADLFEGHTFSTIEEGFAYVNEVGFEALQERAEQAANELPRDIVYAGISLGVMSAQNLASTREGGQGALFISSCAPPSAFDSPWPVQLPVQIHGMDQDPFFAEEGDLEAAQELVANSECAELFVYKGDQHFIVDDSLQAYDAETANLLLQRVRDFLDRVDARRS